MATYQEIIKWVKENHGFTAQSCWIAHILSEHGLITKVAPNRRDLSKRTKPCPAHRREKLEEAMRFLGRI
ncbi:hypothetical protein DmGdi_17950 [Gluconobacter sp. Gdi]|nr:hypothetical protein DmGdi_17950 [Gluconobacter sp. Gdi]